jgi:hypothetical protein
MWPKSETSIYKQKLKVSEKTFTVSRQMESSDQDQVCIASRYIILKVKKYSYFKKFASDIKTFLLHFLIL